MNGESLPNGDLMRPAKRMNGGKPHANGYAVGGQLIESAARSAEQGVLDAEPVSEHERFDTARLERDKNVRDIETVTAKPASKDASRN
jgi:hypothetical protein